MPYEGHYARVRAEKEIHKEQQPKSETPTAGKTETFFTCHVKLITFLICVAVFLAVFGPFGYFYFVLREDTPDYTDERLISESEMEALADKGGALTWKDFAAYPFEVIINQDGCYIRQYDVQGGRYYFYVSAEAEGAKISSVLLVDRENNYTQRELIVP